MACIALQSTTTIHEIEKIAAAAQIAALKEKTVGLEEERDELDRRVNRAMKMAREAQTAERELEETMESLREENIKIKKEAEQAVAAAKQKIKTPPPSPTKSNANQLQKQQEDAIERAKQSTESRMKLEHNRAITKLRSEHASTTRNLKTKLKEMTDKTENTGKNKQSNNKDAIEMQGLKNKVVALEKREIALNDLLIVQENTIEERILKRIQVVKTDSDRRRRQIEQCLSLAEERADRAEAEAHVTLVESQLASTLGIKVYELEREKDMHLLNINALQKEITRMKVQMKEVETRYETLMKELNACQAERSHLEVRNIALASDIRRMANEKKTGAGSNIETGDTQTSTDVQDLQQALMKSEQRNAVLQRRALESKSELQRLVL